ncbi:MAG TPA: alpha-glucosidase C-terminal domain-containing protein, partial [Terrimicrobiaceae bacterium]|nr:alpha-glucosidase C-terminal domain-containing protein [Terrimicrobiaceae bacterium]
QVSPEEFINHMLKTSRDHSRTPMQWDDSAQAGFTTCARPWLAVNPNYKELNAERALADTDSVYHHFRRMIDLRKNAPSLIYGDYHDLDPAHPVIFCYTRSLGTDRCLIVLNFSSDKVTYTFPGDLKAGRLLLSNLETQEMDVSSVNLQAWEARVYEA